MSPVACPFTDCGRYAGHPGRCTPDLHLTPGPAPTTSEADRCYLRADGTCGRVDHPTARSACNQEHVR